ncbi:CpaF family protein [uncultured Olegusella sp.]|uniref:CpaF family protein n=1 Tax=uncultured Olegusella sp. TaxID=1979846 RepID=UPI002621B8C9|nr:CpaF family protein [uncultured Olegusella sp.]
MSVLERVLEQEKLSDSQQGETAEDKARRERLGKLRWQLKRDMVDRLGLETMSQLVGGTDVALARSELRVCCQSLLHGQFYLGLSAEEHELLITQVLDEICGLGPLQSLLDDERVTEVMVNGPKALFFEKEGQIYPSELAFDSAEQVMVVIDRILAPLGRRLDRASPIVNARLANGDRVNAVAAPIAIDGPSMTIRKFSNRITSLAELVRLGSLPKWYAKLLSWAVRLRQDIAVAGGTGSGKTTLLNALSCEIGIGERIVTIEDSAELRFEAHPDVVRLEARDASIEGSGAITIRDLVKNSLRMRPDRIVVGEVRGGEAIDMLQAMNTGHDGSLTTLHAGTAEEAVLRLVLMARFGMDLPADIIEEQITSALDFIVMGRRLPSGQRRITAMSEVGRGSTGGVRLDECVSYDMASDTWTFKREPDFIAQGMEEGVIDIEEVTRWRHMLA